jgi:hypothetical protein
MKRRRGDTQPLGTPGNSWIVNRLDIYAVLVEQLVADLLAQHGIANHYRYNMTVVSQVRDTCLIQSLSKSRNAPLLLRALDIACFQIADTCQGARSVRWRQGGRKNEPRSKTADEIAKDFRGRDLTANHAKSLCQRAFDNRQPVALPIALGDTSAT